MTSRYSAERRRMAELFPWLHRLWYLLVVGGAIALICDIAFLSLGMEFRIYDNGAFALIADSVTIFVSAYFIWGRGLTEPLLAFSASSAPWKRFLRVFGTCLLIVSWIMNRRPTVAGIAVGIVLAAEMILGYHIGSLQRKLLLRGHRWQEKQEKPAATDRPEAGARGGEEDRTAVESSEIGASRNSWESMDRDDTSARAVEIVRPPEVNPETTMYTQFLLGSYLGQFQRLQLAHLHNTWQQGHSERGESGMGKDRFKDATEVKGEEDAVAQGGNSQLNGQDDPFKESSFKYEVPIDTPLEAAAAGFSSLAPAGGARILHTLVHPPSAPSLSSSTAVEDRQDISVRPLPDQAPKDGLEKDPSSSFVPMAT